MRGKKKQWEKTSDIESIRRKPPSHSERGVTTKAAYRGCFFSKLRAKKQGPGEDTDKKNLLRYPGRAHA